MSQTTSPVVLDATLQSTNEKLDAIKTAIENNPSIINDLDDVNITAPKSGDVLKYDAVNHVWANGTGGGGGGASSWDDLTDKPFDELGTDFKVSAKKLGLSYDIKYKINKTDTMTVALSTIPTDAKDRLFQYVGEDTSEYKFGHFYKAVVENEVIYFKYGDFYITTPNNSIHEWVDAEDVKVWHRLPIATGTFFNEVPAENILVSISYPNPVISIECDIYDEHYVLSRETETEDIIKGDLSWVEVEFGGGASKWDDLTDKPFKSIGNDFNTENDTLGLAVDVTNKIKNLDANGKIDYSNVKNAPSTNGFVSVNGNRVGSNLYVTGDTHYMHIGDVTCGAYSYLMLLITSSFWGNQHGSADIISIQNDISAPSPGYTAQQTHLAGRGGNGGARDFYTVLNGNVLSIYVYVTGGNSYGAWNVSVLRDINASFVFNGKQNVPIPSGKVLVSKVYSTVAMSGDYRDLSYPPIKTVKQGVLYQDTTGITITVPSTGGAKLLVTHEWNHSSDAYRGHRAILLFDGEPLRAVTLGSTSNSGVSIAYPSGTYNITIKCSSTSYDVYYAVYYFPW